MEVLINIFGSVTLMLWGIRMVRTGVMRSFGAELRQFLSASAGSHLRGFGIGFAVTTVLQSSAATALILASFAGQGLIGSGAALAIILGADVGTTVVVQVLSFNLDWLSPILIGGGVILFLTSEGRRRRNVGRVMIGLGLVLLALHLIGQASAPLRSDERLSIILRLFTDEIVLAVIATALLTWLAHSSVAIILFVMSLAALQVLSLQLALAMVLGANLGGAIIPVAVTLTERPAGRRVAVGNLLMRSAGVIVGIQVLPWAQPYLSELGSNPGRMVANFHTLFNLALAFGFLPVLAMVDGLTRRLIPDASEDNNLMAPKYLDPASLDTPTVALTCAARETLAMGDGVRHMLVRSLEVFRNNDSNLLREIESDDDTIDHQYEAIKLYVTRISKEELDDAESDRGIEIMTFTTNLEHIGDIIDKNLMELAAKKIKKQVNFSDAGLAELHAFHNQIIENFDLAMNVFMCGDVTMARNLVRQKNTVRDLERRYIDHHFDRIAERRPESIETSSLHVDVLRDLKRINSHLTAVAYPILDRAGELSETRLLADVNEAIDSGLAAQEE